MRSDVGSGAARPIGALALIIGHPFQHPTSEEDESRWRGESQLKMRADAAVGAVGLATEMRRGKILCSNGRPVIRHMRVAERLAVQSVR